MALADDIAALPAVPADGMAGHDSNHGTIHAALKAIDTLVAGYVSTSGTDTRGALDGRYQTIGSGGPASDSSVVALVTTGGTATKTALDAAYAPTARTITAGTGLTGGGDLTANRTLTVAYGATSTTAAVGNDARLTDARTPTAHAASHITGGSDALTAANVGAASSALTVTAGTGLTGGGDLTANRTFTVAYGTSSTTSAVGNDARLSDSRNAKAIVVAATGVSGTYTPDASALPGTGGMIRLSLVGNVTLATPTSPTDGQTITFQLIQDATGGRTLTLSSGYAATADVVTPVLSTTPSKRDYIIVKYDTTVTKWHLMAVNKGA